MNILITGGAGFIGFHLAKYLAERAHELTLCDNLFRGKMDEELQSLLEKYNVDFLNIDLTEKGELNKLKRDYDLTYHLAAINGTRFFYKVPYKVLRTNILTLMNTLDWATETGCNKLVWLSSSEVYSSTARLVDLLIPTKEDIALAIDDIFNPRFSYAGSKIVGELMCINIMRNREIDIRIVRPHNIYGSRMGQEHVIPEFLVRILKREDPFKIYGAYNSRAFCYIDDAVRALVLTASSKATKGEVINIGNDTEEIKIIDLAKKMFDLFDYHPKLEIHPAPKGCIPRRCPCLEKAKKLLGYEPRVDLETGLELTYNWYRKQFQ